MADLLSFKSQRRVEEEASVWLSRMDRGLDAGSRAALEAWIAQDPRHARQLVAMAALWDDMDLLRELSGLLELPARAAPARRARWELAGAAAACAAVIAVAAFIVARPDDAPASGASAPPALASAPAVAGPAGSPVAELRYDTAIGAQRTEVLPDGSIVKLNTATRVVVRQDPEARRVEVLDGEAHFEVRHDPARPFVVTAAGRRIRAVGTAFNVRLESDGALLLTVTEGRVRVSGRVRDAGQPSGAPEAEVTAGERLVADAQGADPWQVEPLDRETLSNRLAWQRGMLVFEGEPLEAALREVSRYADVRFEIRDEAVRQVRIGGVYKSGDIEGLLQSLERNFGVVASRLPDGRVVISAR